MGTIKKIWVHYLLTFVFMNFKSQIIIVMFFNLLAST
jgi:hypothetical protein